MSESEEAGISSDTLDLLLNFTTIHLL